MIEHLWTGLAFGVLGSLHCIGMCGPIAVSLPYGQRSRLSMMINRTTYNLGRIVTYSLFGLLAGLVGEALRLTDYQQTISIVAGVTILLAVLLPSRFVRRVLPTRLSEGIYHKLNSAWKKVLGKRGPFSFLLIGVLNGFLPCGLVYLAVAGAVAANSITSSILYMALFGLGTVPVMLATSFVGPVLGVRARRALQRVVPVGATVIALLLILRGMSLGIPYVSPDLSNGHAMTEEHSCH